MCSAHLESAGGDVATALEGFYDDGAQQRSAEPAPAASAAAAPAEPEGPRTLSGAPVTDSTPWPRAGDNSAGRARPASGSRRPQGGIMTFNDLRGGAGDADEGPDDDPKDDPLNLFTGGERSGLNVENPDHLRRSGLGGGLVNDILKKAASHEAPASEGSASSGRGAPRSAFSGTGHTIGGETTQNEAEQEPAQPRGGGLTSLFSGGIPGLFPGRGGAPSAGVPPPEEEDEEPAVRHLTFWQDGFSIEDGPLHRYDEPGNQEILQAIHAGRAPLHLLNVRFGQPVELIVARRTHEPYTPPPPPPAQPFSGEGNRLGSAAPAPSPGAAPAAVPAAPSSGAEPPAVDASQPTTQVQVRLPDGQRLIAKLNHHHTVAQLRDYINAYVTPWM